MPVIHISPFDPGPSPPSHVPSFHPSRRYHFSKIFAPIFTNSSFSPNVTQIEHLMELSHNCDMLEGTWVIDDSYPFYKYGSCPHIDETLGKEIRTGCPAMIRMRLMEYIVLCVDVGIAPSEIAFDWQVLCGTTTKEYKILMQQFSHDSIVFSELGKNFQEAIEVTNKRMGAGMAKFSCKEVEAVQGNMILLSGVDLVDGTPILDVKPYPPYCDSIGEAEVSNWLMGDNLLKVTSVSFSVDFTSAMENCWEMAEKKSLYTSPGEFKSLIKLVLSWDVRSLSQ